MGEPDKVTLKAALEYAGWRVEPHQIEEWWVHDCWKLTSTWRPNEATAFVTLLVDPQADDPQRSDRIEFVWAIDVSLNPPIDWRGNSKTTIRVKPNWPQSAKDIVDLAATFRPLA